MEFTTQTPNPPKNLYPCLATITIVPHGTDTKRRTSSFGSSSGDEGLSRVISGGRRKTSFGIVADRGDHADAARRRSFGAQGGVPSGSALGSGDEISGKWYWRVQAGTTDHQLILLPLSNPPNPVLTTRPQPLSHAMPAHSKEHGGGDGHIGHTEEHEGIGTKIKNLFRKSSTTRDDRHDTSNTAHGQVADHNDTTSGTASTTATAVDRVIDQTPQGEMLPSTNANAHGATNLNANAETGYPGMINGQHLGAIIVDLRNVDKSKVSLGLGKKNEGSTVTVHVSGGHGINPVGSNHHDSPKSGTIKFEFDKDWIGAKGEAELLHHYITTAIDNYAGGGGHFPQSTNFQLGGGNTTGNNGSGVTGGATGTTGPFSGTSGNTFGGAHTGQNFQHTQGNPLGNEVAPDHRVAT